MVYEINRSPLSNSNLKINTEILSGKVTYYDNLRVFGALAFAHVKKDKLEA